jgi:hypothetical protein
MVLATQLTVVLHTASRVICHSSLTSSAYDLAHSRPPRHAFRSENVILLVDSLYAETTEAVMLLAALSASSLE